MSLVLTDLAREYAKWSNELVRRTRFANDLDGMDDAEAGRASNAVAEARIERDEIARRYIETSEQLRSKQCGHHPDALIVSCVECCRAFEFEHPADRAIRELQQQKGGGR